MDADRLSVSKAAQSIIERIDGANYFDLGKESISRSELFLFAMALGSDTVPTRLDKLYPGGLVLEKSIDSATLAGMYALFIAGLEEDRLDDITDKGAVYKNAQEYANTGFENIDHYMQKKKNPEDLAWELLTEIDAQYAACFPPPAGAENERS